MTKIKLLASQIHTIWPFFSGPIYTELCLFVAYFLLYFLAILRFFQVALSQFVIIGSNLQMSYHFSSIDHIYKILFFSIQLFDNYIVYLIFSRFFPFSSEYKNAFRQVFISSASDQTWAQPRQIIPTSIIGSQPITN